MYNYSRRFIPSLRYVGAGLHRLLIPVTGFCLPAVFLAGLLVSAYAFAEKELPVRCTGDSVTYVKEENTIYGKGNVEIGYEGNYIRADNVRVNIKTKEAWADGRVIVSDGVNVFTADKVYYNFDTGKATVDGISSTMYPWFARGKQGERISKDLYHIKNGYITTCDYEKPHQRVQAKDIYIYPGDKVVAKHIVFYWGKVPLFYWPYYSRSLKDEESRWILIPGYNDKFGAFLITGYKMWWDNFLGGRLEPILRLDYYQKRGLAAGVYSRYRYKDKIESLIRSYIIKDKAYKRDDGQTVEKTRGRFSMDYVQKITNDTRGLMKVNYLSDPTIIADFFRGEFQDEVQTETYIDIAKTTPKYQLSLMVKKRLLNFYTDLERLPELSFNLIEQQIMKTNLLYTCSASIGYLAQRFSEADGGEDYSAARFDTTHQLRYPRKYLGWLNIIPRIGTRQTYWNKRAKWETNTTTTTQTTPTPPGAIVGTTTSTTTSSTSTSTTTTATTTTVDPVNTTITTEVTTNAKKEWDKGTWRSIYFTGAEFTTKIARVFFVQSPFWQVNQLRHVIEPRLNYVYQHTPTVLSKDLLNFGDLADKDNHFELGLRNKLQTRRGTTWDLVDFNIGANYYPEKYMEGTEERSFSHITGRLELRPFDWVSMDMDFNWDQYDRQIDTYNTELVFYKDDKLSFGLGYRYMLNSDKLWTSEINYMINSNWAIRLHNRYEFDSGQMQYQEYVLVRDMHCWNLAFCFRDYHNINETAYFIVFYPKAYPNIPITFGTTYFGVDDTSKIDFGMK